MLCLVTRQSVGGILGSDVSAPFVVSRRTTQEKEPWKSLSGVKARVEAEFVRPVLLGESILPYRIFGSFEGIIPTTDDGILLDAQSAASRGYSGLQDWMRSAERVWEERRAAPISLVQQFDYYGKLSAQFPIPALRIIYAASGTISAACLLRDPRSIVEHSLYWTSPACDDEAHYLAVILNSETTRKQAEALQARGQWGARHFDKVMFTLPIPRFDPTTPLHLELASAGKQAEKLAATVELPDAIKFQRARKLIRDALAENGISQLIDNLVAKLLDG
jgi:hypothetical protein